MQPVKEKGKIHEGEGIFDNKILSTPQTIFFFSNDLKRVKYSTLFFRLGNKIIPSQQ